MAPLYEAVSNSIHAIEDAAPSAGRIRIQITRDTQLPIAFEATDGSSGPKATRDITGFKMGAALLRRRPKGLLPSGTARAT